ncbi:MAG: hypothetical protein [Bacteriophage sp.]|nr:MAG: hypothetical protein [Bacteriophage sp.]
MDKFDRNVQRDLLLALYESSPDGINHSESEQFESAFGGISNYVANLRYLAEHGLLVSRIDHYSHGYEITPELMKITSKGIDFIRNDGGLGAILNVVNIRLHSDTINKLEAIIGASNVPEEEKETMISTLRKLPEDAIKHLNLKLLDVGLARLPDAFHAIQIALHNLF